MHPSPKHLYVFVCLFFILCTQTACDDEWLDVADAILCGISYDSHHGWYYDDYHCYDDHHYHYDYETTYTYETYEYTETIIDSSSPSGSITIEETETIDDPCYFDDEYEIEDNVICSCVSTDIGEDCHLEYLVEN